MSYDIKLRGPIGRELQDCARRELNRSIDALQSLNQETAAHLTHDVRKRLKKLRALLTLLRAPLGKKRCREENKALRDVARALATPRDAQALGKTLDQFQRRYFPDRSPTVLRALRRDQLHHEKRCVAALCESPVVDQSIAALAAALDRVAEWPIDGYGWKDLRRAVRRSYQRSRESYERAHDAPTDARLHRWRKEIKALWFHLRLLRRASPVVMEELAQDYEVLAEFLGDDHDLVVLRASLKKRGKTAADEAAVATLFKLVDLRREELLDAAFDLGERLLADDPEDFAAWLDELRSTVRKRTRKSKKLASELTAAE